MKKVKETVRDGFFCDLPEDLQRKVIDANKTVANIIDETLKDPAYADLKSSNWAMSCIDDFKTKPSDKGDVGSVRIFRKGNKFECMIQATGHFRNHQYGWIEELLHDFIRDVYQSARTIIRKKHDLRLDDEGDGGEAFEGFDVYPSSKIAKEMWDKFEDRKTKAIKEDGYEIDLETGEIMFEKRFVPEVSDDLALYYELYKGKMSYDDYFNERSHGKLKYDFRSAYDVNTGHLLKIVYSLDNIKIQNDKNLENNISKKGNLDHQSHGQKVLAIIDIVTGQRLKSATVVGIYTPGIPGDAIGKLDISNIPSFKNNKFRNDKEYMKQNIFTIKVGEVDNNDTYKSTNFFKKHNVKGSDHKLAKGTGHDDELYDMNFLKINLAAKHIKDGRGAKIKDIDLDPMFNGKSGKVTYHHPSKSDIKNNPNAYKKESVDTPEYNVEMPESQAKKTLRTLSQGLINDFAKDKNKKVTQYTANIYANIITKNLLPKWANGYKKFSIVLDSYQSFFTFEFKVPTMSQDFISRYINGREPINAFLHRIPEIKVKMSPRIFHTMKDPDDAFNFFKAAIKYYDSGIEKYSKSLMSEAMKLNHNMKHLISTTKLSGIVTYPMQLLFVFDDVHMDNKNTFSIDQNDIKKINQFFKNIYTNYAAPEKEKKKIVEDVKEMVKVLRESCEYDENIKSICYLPEEVDKLLSGGYDDQIEIADSKFIREQVDFDDMRNQKNPQVTYLQEKFGVKKLKKIPTDLIAYITIETESIRDANDKMMIASYTLGKIEIVEWYIELIDTGSKKYVVPHTKPYLETVRTQLLACYKKIMDTPIPKNNDRPLIDVKYPKGHEG